MPYIRKKGNQLVLVHGEREDDGRVQQRVLFTIYSKAEALAVLGKPDEGKHRLFKDLIESKYPALRFNWKAIAKAISDNLEVLPDLYAYQNERMERTFRKDLGAFAKQLFSADPQHLLSAARLIKSHEAELELLSELIEWRVRLSSQEESEWNRDNSFCWRFTLQGPGAPYDAMEFVTGYYERGEYRLAEAGFRLLTENFDRFADGYNYLGLIALDEKRYDDAIDYFRETIEVGRTLFPKRTSKKRYWQELNTRPYMRGLRNLAHTLNLVGRFDETLEVCDRLSNECGDDITAQSQRAVTFLNQQRWLKAYESARYVSGIHKDAAFIEAFALEALSNREDALSAFLHAALNYPRAAKMLVGVRIPKRAVEYEEARDHNEGVSLLAELHAYLARPPSGSKQFFKRVMTDERVEGLIQELLDSARRWHADRQGKDRSAFARMNLMRSRQFAESEVHRLGDLLAPPSKAGNSQRRAADGR